MHADDRARALVATLQAAVDGNDHEALVACFAPDPVLAGTTTYVAGADGVRRYLAAVAQPSNRLHWDLEQYDVYLDQPGLLGFGAVGHVEWDDGEDSARSPFRLTIVAQDLGEGWRVLHFHGSVPDA